MKTAIKLHETKTRVTIKNNINFLWTKVTERKKRYDIKELTDSSKRTDQLYSATHNTKNGFGVVGLGMTAKGMSAQYLGANLTPSPQHLILFLTASLAITFLVPFRIFSDYWSPVTLQINKARAEYREFITAYTSIPRIKFFTYFTYFRKY